MRPRGARQAGTTENLAGQVFLNIFRCMASIFSNMAGDALTFFAHLDFWAQPAEASGQDT